LQQFREAIPSEHAYRFLIRDRDSIFSEDVDRVLKEFGLKILRTPIQAPKANAYCERLLGTMRPECLDWLIPLNEKHLRGILREWVTHYNRGRPHASLGSGIPEPTKNPSLCAECRRHELPEGLPNHDKRRHWRTPPRILVGESGSLEFRPSFCGQATGGGFSGVLVATECRTVS